MARSFNGTSDVLKTSVGSPMNVAFGTFAAIVNVTSFAATRSIMRLATTTPTNVLGFSVNTTGNLILTDGVSAPAGATALVAGEWYLIAAGKATGTTTPRYHIYRYSTNTWVHENAGGTVANATVPGTTGRMNLMARAADQFTPGDLAVAGFWGRLLSDAEVEQLPFTVQGWHSTAPNGLWILDQGDTAQSVPDQSGNGGNQASLTGTTVSTNSVPVFGYGSDVVKPYAIPPNVSNIVFRALGTTSKVASGNMSPGLPAGTAQNDILILVTSQQDNVSCSVTGYTQVSAVNNGTNCRQEVWIKRAGASESAPTVTHTSGGVSNAVIAAYSGVDTGLTIGVGAGAVIRDLQTAAASVTSTTCTGPALSGVVLYDMLVFAGMFTVNDTSGATTNNWTTVSGFTEERDDCSSLAGAWGTSFAIDDVRATGTAGAVTSTIGYLGSLTTERNIGCQLALSSAVTGGGTPTGSATLTSVGSLSAAGSAAAAGSSVLSSVATLASVGNGLASGSASLSSGASLVAAGSSVASGSASPTSTAALASAGNAQASGSAALTSAAAIAASGVPGLNGSATLISTASLTPAGSAAASSSGVLTSQGTLAPSGSAVATGSAVLTSAATLSSAGATGATGSSTLTSQGALTSVGSALASGVATLTSTAALVGSGSATANGASVFTSSGALVGTGAALATGTASLTSTGSLRPAGASGSAGAATFTSVATLGAAGSAVATGASLLAGQAALVSAGSAMATGSGALVSAGHLAGTGAAGLSGSAVLTSGASLSATAASAAFGAVVMTVAGQITPAGLALGFGQAAFSSGGQLAGIGVVGAGPSPIGEVDIAVSAYLPASIELQVYQGASIAVAPSQAADITVRAYLAADLSVIAYRPLTMEVERS